MDERIRRSRKQERRGAKMFGGTVNAGSGNGARKNDVRTPTESIEFKSTRAASYSIKLADLGASWIHAINDSRRMLFGIEFAARERGIIPTRYVVMTEADYLELRGDDGTAT